MTIVQYTIEVELPSEDEAENFNEQLGDLLEGTYWQQYSFNVNREVLVEG